MKQIVEAIDMPLDCVAYVEKAQYELAGRRTLLAFAANNRDIDDEKFQQLLDRYMDGFIEYEFIMDELRELYVPDEYKTNEYNFEVLYDVCQMLITKEVVA